MSVTRTVQQIQQVMRKDPGLDGDAQRISQLSWLLFLRALDQRFLGNPKGAYGAHPLPKALRWENWARESDMSATEVLEFVDDLLLPALRSLKGSSATHGLVREVFAGVRNYMTSGALLREVLGHVESLIHDHTASEDHFVGDVYEKILSDLQNAGNAGEFYTPKAITDLMVSLVAPSANETVLDFACGTGGFLVSCLEHNRRTDATSSTVASLGLRGIEKKSVPYLLCVTNLLLHGHSPAGGVIHGNLLTRDPFSLSSSERVDVVVTNPPFGAMEEESIQHNFPPELRSKDTADLFVIALTQVLKLNGRAAIVLPDGFLFATGVKMRIRKLLLESCNVHTIVRLPKGVFSPYTSIATNVVFLTKGEPTRETWFYEQPTPAHLKSYSKTKPVALRDFQKLVEWWPKRKESEYAWKVSIADIAARDYRLDCRKSSLSSGAAKPDTALAGRRSAQQKAHDQRIALSIHITNATSGQSEEQLDALLANLDVLTSTAKGLDNLTHALLALAMAGKLSSRPSSSPTPVTRALEMLQPDNLRTDVTSSEDRKWRIAIPREWELLRLDEVARIESGGTPPTGDLTNFADEGVPWLTPADLYGLQSRYISRGKRDLSVKGLQQCSAKLLPPGTVLFSSRAPIGYLAIAACEIATNQGFKSCVPFVPAMNEFLYYFLMYERRWIEDAAPGTTFKEVSGRHMKAILMPAPSLEEQQQIVSVLSGSLAIVSELRAAVKELSAAQAAAEMALEQYVSLPA